jgi:hypothetical protein
LGLGTLARNPALPDNSDAVIPAKAGIQKQREEHTVWMPAFAGMTVAG